MSTWVTMGGKVKRFEEMWAEYRGVEEREAIVGYFREFFT